jgi:hypothetical protein
MVNLERALQTEGWMSEPELAWLSEKSQHGIVVEVGSWMGRTTRAMADSKLDGTIFAVDTWEGSVENKELLKDKPHGYLFHQFYENLKDHIATGLVVPIRLPSLKAASHFSSVGLKLNMCFIDASHEYEDVKSDIIAWRQLVPFGSLLCGHDYDWGFPGVVYAVRELISQTPNQAANGSSIWYTYIGENK